MATVKFTNKLEADVKDFLSTTYKKRIRLIEQEAQGVTPTPQELTDYAVAVEGKAELYEKCKDWLQGMTSMWPTIVNPDGARRSISYYSFSPTLRAPDYVKNGDIRMPNEAPAGFETTHNRLSRLFELDKQIDDIRDELQTITNSVLNAFRAYPSVNAAVKAHPELEHMLPWSTKEKMAEKTTRVKQVLPDVHLDKEKLMTVAVLNRLGA